jgi:soluble lytic murein transglycosylase-like protein
MSTQALTGMSVDELAVMQRVQQLQTLVEAARRVAAGMPAGTLGAASAASGTGAQTYGTDFASALQAATSAEAAGVAEPSAAADTGAADASSLAGYAGIAYPSEVAYEPTLQGEGTGGASGGYESLIEQAAARNGLDPAVLHGLIEQESGFDPSATSGAGAAGLTQLMPGTASSLGVANPLDPAESIEGGARYLGQLMSEFGGNTSDALAAYNAGPDAVQEYGGIPPYAETESYVSKVLGYAEAYRQDHPATITGGLA